MLGLFSACHTNSVEADMLESLVMPGPVIKGHAKYESSCRKCHSLFDQEKQTALCLDCHEDIDRDLADKTGFHGRSGTIRNTECRSCHTDHIGRTVDITGLNRGAFDHGLTDFKLTGRHQTIACNACHVDGKKFRDAPGGCIDCHERDDIHRETLGNDCDSCHTTRQWKKTLFDHDETEFSLEGAHAEAVCNSCHLSNSYKNTPTQCNDCHRVDDVHNKSYGSSCGDCHEPSKWKTLAFDHDRETDFPLHGKHQSALCSSCHKDDLKADKLDTDCNACHAQDDIHRNRFGQNCGDCHSESNWKKSSFQHDKATDFPLKGNHKKVSCENCHHSEAGKVDQARGCIDCHRSDDVHKDDEGTHCSRCHNEQGWSKKIRFDHDLTNFPLIGLHTALPCEACHLSGKFQEASK
ncbi:MAG: cytochrome C, partial [Gammaproteobacteria bacterium]|nr:cytochrome C [Gammaproteobacteria bacterium]